jgi:hypothetical protein
VSAVKTRPRQARSAFALDIAPGSFMISLLRRTMSMATSAAPAFKPFNLALIQLGGVTADKTANLRHAREMLLKAAKGEGAKDGVKPELVVLPVCHACLLHV